MTDPMMVEIYGHMCRLSFLVIDHEGVALLGLDFFMSTGAVIYPMKGILKFPAQKIHIQGDDPFVEDEHRADEVLLTEIVDVDDIAEDIFWEKSSPTEMHDVSTGFHLKPAQKKAFSALIKKFEGVFPFDITKLCTCNLGEHKIRI